MDSRSAITDVQGRPYAVMGIVNVTPDSFYDGGRYASEDAAFEHGLRLASEGADIIDIGGASSRPGAAAVPPEEEAARAVPVIRRLAREFKGIISVDTTRASVARRALEAGAAWVNDISAGKNDSGMAELAAERGCTVVLMHMRGTPETMQTLCRYGDVVAEVRKELLASVKAFVAAGVRKERIVIDPGIGFAKTAEQNIELLRRLDLFVKTGHTVLAGTSRKSFVGRLTGRGPDERLWGTLGSVGAAFMRGARIFRVHDVAATKDFLNVLSAIEGRGGGGRMKATSIRRTVRGG
ncbi:MAG: dihydropteroate synthase [Chitinispirillaceae bacterium]|nr:dihydropteroate synthase [Chitinispirillaceae bacterium]